MRRSGALLALILGCYSLVILSSCQKEKTGSWSDGKGTEIQWSPASIRLADMAEVTATFPAGTEAALLDPSNKSMEALQIRQKGALTENVWRYRVTKTGEWTWKNGDSSHPLWTVKSEAGATSELKKIDAQKLWEGKE